MRRYPATPADAVGADVGFDGQLRGWRSVATLGPLPDIEMAPVEQAAAGGVVYRMTGLRPGSAPPSTGRLWTPGAA